MMTSTAISTRVPPLSLILATLSALALAALGAAALLLPPGQAALLAIGAGQLLAAAILLFLSGVRRGLSFFTPGGPRWVQVATSMWLFAVGLATTVLPGTLAFGIAAIGYLSVALLDPLAARRGEVPDYFARLRPPQMALFVAGSLLLLIATRMPMR